MNVLSSQPGLFNFDREGVSSSALMKRYALLFDNVIFNRFGAPIGDNSASLANNLGEWMSLVVTPGANLEERKKLGRNTKFSSIFIDCWDLVSDPGRFEMQKIEIIDKGTHDRISDFCFREIRRKNSLPDDSYKFDIDDVHELGSDITSEIGMNMLLLSEGVDLIPSYSPLIGRALESEIKRNTGECYEIFQTDLITPDFDALSWDEILELREDGNILAFRKVVFELLRRNTDVDAALFKKVQDDLWSLVTDIKPNLRQTFLEAIGSNLPSPIIVNPIGLAASLRDIYQSNELTRKYGHIFLYTTLSN